MKLKKTVFWISFLCMTMFPVCASARGSLSGIGILVDEAEQGKADVYQVTLPTGSDLGIVLDPEGLVSISEKGEYDPSWAGRIHTAEGGGALFINRSSFPVSVSVGISVDRDREGTPSGIALLDSADYVDDGAFPQMYLTVTPGADKIQSMDEFVPSDVNIPVLSAENQEMTAFSFLLDGADYIWNEDSGEYTLADYEGNYDSASFVLGGRVNKNADWSDYVGAGKEKVIIRAVYTIQRQRDYDRELLYPVQEKGKTPHALMKESVF